MLIGQNIDQDFFPQPIVNLDCVLKISKMRIPLQDENRYLSFSGRLLTPVVPIYNKDESIRALDERETFACMVTLTEVIQTDITNKRSEESDQNEVDKFARFPNVEMMGYINDNTQKAKQKDYSSENLEEDISNKQLAATLEEVTCIAVHDEDEKIMGLCFSTFYRRNGEQSHQQQT